MLGEKRCKPCEGGIPALAAGEVTRLLTEVPGWTVNEASTEIRRTFAFEDYYETIAFVNAVAWIAHREDHHPELEVGFKKCTVRYRTHAVGGLSENDFICAAKVNALGDGDR